MTEELNRARLIRDRLASAGLLDSATTIAEIRFRYFSAGPKGPRFGWTTQRDADGKFQSFIWDDDGDLQEKRRHAKRKNAKARALRLYEREQWERP